MERSLNSVNPAAKIKENTIEKTRKQNMTTPNDSKLPVVKLLVCKDDGILAVDTTIEYPHILKLFLGLVDGPWKAPKTDEYGRLTFLKDFGIHRSSFMQCISFIRSGFIPFDAAKKQKLTETFNILGGCKEYDNALRELFREEHDNPLRPEDDTSKLYAWRTDYAVPDEPNRHVSDGYSPVSTVHDNGYRPHEHITRGYLMWYRKPILNDN